MKLTLKVVQEGNAYEVTTSLANIIEWERKFKAKASSLANGIGMEDLAFLAWSAAKSSGVVVPLMFDDYVKRLEAIEVVSQETENPTNGEPTHEG